MLLKLTNVNRSYKIKWSYHYIMTDFCIFIPIIWDLLNLLYLVFFPSQAFFLSQAFFGYKLFTTYFIAHIVIIFAIITTKTFVLNAVGCVSKPISKFNYVSQKILIPLAWEVKLANNSPWPQLYGQIIFFQLYCFSLES